MSLHKKWIFTECQYCKGTSCIETLEVYYDSAMGQHYPDYHDIDCNHCEGKGALLVEVLVFNPSSIDHLEAA